MIKAKGFAQAGQIVVGTKDDKSYFYLVLGAKKKEIEEMIQKASLFSTEKMKNLVLNTARYNLYIMKIMPVEVSYSSDEYIGVKDEETITVDLIKKLQSKTKAGTRIYPCFLHSLDSYSVLTLSIRPTMLRRLTNDSYISLEEVQEMVDKAYRDMNNIMPSNDLIAKEVYCYQGIKMARFYLYLGNDSLYALCNCPNDAGCIKSLYKGLAKSRKMSGGVYNKIGELSSKVRGMYNKGKRLNLYDTGIRYDSVSFTKRQKAKLKSSYHFTDEMIGELTGV